MGRNTGKIYWVQVRKCLRNHSEELVIKRQKKKIREGERRGREAGLSDEKGGTRRSWRAGENKMG